jgi:hypothetical protein
MALFEPVLVPALLAAIALLSSSFLLQGLPPIARRFRWKRIENSLNLYLHHGVLLLPAALVLGGCAGGLLAAKGEIQTLGGWIEFAAQIILLQGVLSIFPAASGEISRFDIWLLPIATVLSLAFDVLGKVLKVDPAFAERSVFLVQAIPLLGLLAGLALLPALLRPFTWRHIFDRRLPFGFRTVLTVLALTAILPLGGLAVPFWIWARQRLWPRYAITSLLSSTRISR